MPRKSKQESSEKLEAFKEFLDVVNERRPYCSADFKKQTFIRDLSALDKQRGN
ncbi:MAG: hypothetical protein IKP24_00930 [Alphaproteobacteria bacterium]|nr:hypothetical protein [Alphaproteobacteria bacterium]